MATEKILGYEEIACGKFLRLGNVIFQDAGGRVRKWEAAGRVKQDAAEKGEISHSNAAEHPGAVVIWCTVRSTGEWVIVDQFRPPAGCHVLEFPAGLIDPGEEPAETAVRELWEETGLQGRVEAVSFPAINSPGMSGERMVLVKMSVDEVEGGVLPPNHQEDSENITAMLVKPSDLPEVIAAHYAAGGAVDARLVTLAMMSTGGRNV